MFEFAIKFINLTDHNYQKISSQALTIIVTKYGTIPLKYPIQESNLHEAGKTLPKSAPIYLSIERYEAGSIGHGKPHLG